MTCGSCGDKPKKTNKDFTRAVIEIDNPEQIALMRKVVIPASMGDDTTVPPVAGKYHNVLLYYEANSKSYLYSSDGIPTQLVNGVTDYEAAVNLPQINGTTLLGNKTAEQLGLQNALSVADFTGLNLEDDVLSGVPATDSNIGMVKPGDGFDVDGNGVLSLSNIDKYTYAYDTVDEMKTDLSIADGTYVMTVGHNTKNDGYGDDYFISDTQGDNSILLDNGLYATPVKKSVVKFHAIALSSATYIVELPNGKNMIIDTGTAGEWSNIKDVLDAKGWKFDYGIITHFHVDHVGNLTNILSSYVNPDSTWWVQMKPDYTNHSADIVDTEQRYDDTIQIFTDHGITPIVPENDSYVEITEDVKLHFLNTSDAWAENYYGQNAEWHEEDTGINFNFFSLVTEIIHKNNRILMTGDIERIVEETIYPYLHKCSVMTAPHHLVNRDASLSFYQATKPDFVLGMHQSTGFTWLQNWFKSYIYLDEVNTKFITPAGSIAEDGLYSFVSNGYTTSSMVLGNGAWPDYNKQKLVGYFEQLTNYSTQKISTISLKECLLNLTPGWVFKGVYYGTLSTDFPQVATDIRAIFPFIDTGYQIEMCRPPKNPGQAYVKIVSSRAEYTAFTYNLTSTTTTWRSQGDATYQTLIESFSDLVSFLSVRPAGHYRLIYKDDEGTVLDPTGAYDLSIDIRQSMIDDARLTCNIYGVVRSTDNTVYTANVVAGFINATSGNVAHKWTKLA